MHIAPFLKWAGGKRRRVPILLANMPSKYKRYHEPFVGGGALFFALQPRNATISDMNEELMNAYKHVAHHSKALLTRLRRHNKLHSAEHYKRVKTLRSKSDIARAANFIYLNRTCFNGLYRVNNKGEFNVVMGNCANMEIVNHDVILACSAALQNATIKHADFRDCKPAKGDFVYIDPPYHGSFDNYTAVRFREQGQKDLAVYCRELDKKGVLFMVSNAGTPLIKELYDGFNITSMQSHHNIVPQFTRKYEEVIIKNY